MKERYGDDVYKKIGRKGGKISRGGGFGSPFGPDPVAAGKLGAIASAKARRAKEEAKQ